MQEQLKEKVKGRYGKIALTGNSDCCCVPGECRDDSNNSTHHSTIESTEQTEGTATTNHQPVSLSF